MTMSAQIQIDPATFGRHFGRSPMPVKHGLTEHELLTREALAELAEALPEEKVEHNLGTIDAVHPDMDAPKVDLPPGEVVRTIEENKSWMILRNIELHPPYKRLLDETLNEIEPLVRDWEGGMEKRLGFIFLSAPSSTTPSHFDPEHNFLLQVQGSKRMTVGAFPEGEDRDERIERYYGDYEAGANLSDLPASPVDYDLEPTDGIYVPPHDPHWVKNGPETSVSLSVTFLTPTLVARSHAHAVNHRLRRIGLNPKRAGTHDGRDRAKSAAVKTARRVAGAVRRG